MDPNQWQPPQPQYPQQQPVLDSMPPLQPQYQPPQPQPPPRKSRAIVIALLVVLLAAGTMAAVFMLTKNDKKDSNESADPPALVTDRNQLRTQRRTDLSKILASMEEYAANHNGVYPDVANLIDFTSEYMDKDLVDPASGEPYLIQATAPSKTNHVQYKLGATCTSDGTGIVENNEGRISRRAVALLGFNGTNDFTCIGNSAPAASID